MRKHEGVWRCGNDCHNSSVSAGMKLGFSQHFAEKQRAKVLFPWRLEPSGFFILCVYVCERDRVCLLSCVCVYICGPLQFSLGDGDRLPWQQLECKLQWCVCLGVCVSICVCRGHTRTMPPPCLKTSNMGCGSVELMAFNDAKVSLLSPKSSNNDLDTWSTPVVCVSQMLHLLHTHLTTYQTGRRHIFPLEIIFQFVLCYFAPYPAPRMLLHVSITLLGICSILTSYLSVY